MDVLTYLFGILIGVAVLLVIAMPERMFQQKMSKKKMVGPSYWGNYDAGEDADFMPEIEGIEVTVHKRKHKIHVGGNAYHSGRGVK